MYQELFINSYQMLKKETKKDFFTYAGMALSDKLTFETLFNYR